MHTQYQHGGDIYSNKVSMDYSANINPLGLPQGVKEELARCMKEQVCCVYPDSRCTDLVHLWQWCGRSDLWSYICPETGKSPAFSPFFSGI